MQCLQRPQRAKCVRPDTNAAMVPAGRSTRRSSANSWSRSGTEGRHMSSAAAATEVERSGRSPWYLSDSDRTAA